MWTTAAQTEAAASGLQVQEEGKEVRPRSLLRGGRVSQRHLLSTSAIIRAEMIDTTLVAVSSDEMRFNLSGVYAESGAARWCAGRW